MEADEKRRLIERYLEAYNSLDVEGMMALVHENIKFTNLCAGEVNARASRAAEFRTLAEQGKGLFSSREQVTMRFEGDASGASIEVEFAGVLAADLPNGIKAEEVLRRVA